MTRGEATKGQLGSFHKKTAAGSSAEHNGGHRLTRCGPAGGADLPGSAFGGRAILKGDMVGGASVLQWNQRDVTWFRDLTEDPS